MWRVAIHTPTAAVLLLDFECFVPERGVVVVRWFLPLLLVCFCIVGI